MLTFDPVEHRYFWSGQLVPNVTRIIAPLTDYSHIPPPVLEKARQQGVAIHKMVELDCLNNLETLALPEWMQPYYEAWQRFKEESGFECWDVERRVFHRALGYAGTLDLAGPLPKLKDVRGPALIDIKRSLYGGPSIGLQLSAYEDARNKVCERDRRTTRRFALVLKPDKSYRLTEYDDHDDRVAFLACLQQWRWKAKHYPKETAP